MSEPLRDHGEVRQVLRYWLEALRLEQSLASRPRAVRPAAGSGGALGAPRSQTYFRLGVEHAPFMVTASGSAGLAMDDALVRFHEHWLARSRRPRAGADGAGGAPRRSWVIGWPALLLERREELATLFRFPVELAWSAGGLAWEPPAPGRPRGPRPDAVAVAAESAGDEGASPAIWVDRTLLHHALGVADDEIAALERRWTDRPDAAAMAADLLRLLAPDDAARDPAAVFAGLVRAAQARAARGISVYPVGIVQDGELVFATYHLQTDLRELHAMSPSQRPLAAGSALSAYLTGRPAASGSAILRARFRPRGITASQRAAAERFLGSTLSAVQGPPGTGKTELILNLAAGAAVERIGGAVRSAPMRGGLLVVASTNNRAVDNVIDPLGQDFPADRLPLALRIGNQEVIATRTVRELERARDWLAGQDPASATERLSEALAAFQGARGSFDALAGPEIARAERRTRLTEVRRELAALGPAPVVRADEAELRRALVQLRAELVQLQRVARARGRRQLRKLGEAWTRIARGQLAALAGLRAELATALSVALPPEVEDAWTAHDKLEVWHESIEDAIELIDADMPGGRESEALERTRLAEELAALEAEPEGEPLGEAAAREIESLGHALFLHALEVRERWAVAGRDELLEPLDAAIRAAVQQRSLRRQLSRQGSARSPLRALYPVMGCTLLSLGGSFELEADTIDALVIDEAGQCHPAYAIGGLARARRALLIGDVHQLPPVVNLSERDEAHVRRDAAVRIPAERFAPFRVDERGESSAQALADRAVVERPTLTDHFRCQPPIIALCDELCGYGLVVHTPPRSLAARAPGLRAPLLFAGVDGEQVRVRGSWANQAEADRLIALLLDLGAAGIDWSDIGVMAPYVGQVELLRGRLRTHRIPFEAASGELSAAADGEAGGLSLGTVHRFQGGERSVVLFSTVVTEPRSLPFLDDRVNLLNVAVSRARDHLVTFGCERALRAGARTRLLVEHAAAM